MQLTGQNQFVSLQFIISPQSFAGDNYAPGTDCGTALAYHFNGTELAGQMYCSNFTEYGSTDPSDVAGSNIAVDAMVCEVMMTARPESETTKTRPRAPSYSVLHVCTAAG